MASIRDQSESSASQKQGKSQSKKAPREPVSFDQLCVGCIVWMREQDGAQSASCIMPQCPCNRSKLDENGSEHHLVILDVFRTDKGEVRCHVGKVTSNASKAKNFTASIKIHQGPSASSTEQRDLDNGLYLETGELRKQSHVSLGHLYEVSPSLFSTKRGVPAYDRRLSEQSYYHLMKAMRLQATTYQRTRDVEQKGATTRSYISETQANIYYSGALETHIVDLPNVSTTIGTAQRMAAFNTPPRPLPLNSQYRPSSPPQDSPTNSESGVSTASLQSPIFEDPIYESLSYEQHNPHRGPRPSRPGSVHSQMTHSSHTASTITLNSRSSLVSPGHDNTRFTFSDADAAAHNEAKRRQRAMEDEDATKRDREFREMEYQRQHQELAERDRQLQQQELAERDRQLQQQELAERDRQLQQQEEAKRQYQLQQQELIERERQRLQQENAERERQLQQQEEAKRQYQLQQQELIERERQRLQQENAERERQLLQQEEAKRERTRRNLEALEQEHQRRTNEALEKERQRLHAETLEKERQHRIRTALEAEHRIQKERRRRSGESVSTEYLVQTEAAMARQHYLGKIATMEQEHPPQKEYQPQREAAPLGREYLRRTESTRQSEHGRTQARDIGSGGSTASSSWSSSYSRYSKFTQISEYTNTRITEYTRYTSEVVMHGVTNAPWGAMSVGSVVVVGCYSYYSGSYEAGFETAKGLAGGLRAVAGMAGRVLLRAGKALTRLRR